MAMHLCDNNNKPCERPAEPGCENRLAFCPAAAFYIGFDVLQRANAKWRAVSAASFGRQAPLCSARRQINRAAGLASKRGGNGRRPQAVH